MLRLLSLVVGVFIAANASAASLDGYQLLTFGGSVTSLDDPTGALNGSVELGDAFTVRVVIPNDLASVGHDADSLVEGYLDTPYQYSIDVADLTWTTTGTNVFLSDGYEFESSPWMQLSDDAPGGDFFNFTTDPLGVSYGSPIASVPYWEGNVGAGSASRALAIGIDPFAAPDLSTFDFNGGYVYGYAPGGTDPVFRIEATMTRATLDPIPEPSSMALVLGGALVVGWALRRGLRA